MNEFRRRTMVSQEGGEGIPTVDGAYVYTISGKFYTSQKYTSKKAAGKVSDSDVVGVAVISGEHRFVIAKNSLGTKKIFNTTKACAGAESIPNGSQYNHYGGEADTALMVASYGSDSTYAAGAATNYIFANGKHGYLASSGEWNDAYTYKSMVDACLVACGGTAIDTSYGNWTSTYQQINSAGVFFKIDWSSGSQGTNTMTFTRDVRPFCSLD